LRNPLSFVRGHQDREVPPEEFLGNGVVEHPHRRDVRGDDPAIPIGDQDAIHDTARRRNTRGGRGRTYCGGPSCTLDSNDAIA